jgi:hypothetical protein
MEGMLILNGKADYVGLDVGLVLVWMLVWRWSGFSGV